MAEPNAGFAAPAQPFSLHQLWRDENLRGVVIQVLVVLGFFLVVAWLISNVVANFGVLDKSFGFGFLWQLPANYDINQTLIDYTNQDSHLRAAVVGLLNTFLVAVVGIVVATVLGFVIGALRLSSNWLLSQLAFGYIEFMRNVPVLLHVLLWHGIIINTLPHPRQAIGVGDSVFLSNRGFYVPKPILEEGAGIVGVAFAIGIVIAALLYRYAKRQQADTGRQIPAIWMGSGAVIVLTVIAYFATGGPVSLMFRRSAALTIRGAFT